MPPSSSCASMPAQWVVMQPGGRWVDGVFVLNGDGEVGEPRTAEPAPKRPKPTLVNTPYGSTAGNLEIDGMQVGQGKDVSHDAQDAAGEMDVEAEVGTR